MRKVGPFVAVMSLIAVVGVAPATGNDGRGELVASFHAGFSGGAAILFQSSAHPSVASPQMNSPGRLEPFGAAELVCDQLVVGTWYFLVDPDRAVLDAWTSEFKLDGETLELERTPNKRVALGPQKGWWWFAEGVPVLGVLDPGLHEIEWTADDGSSGPFTITTSVEVDSAYC